jgi:putative ABC transport system ATP-binding protein
MRTDVVSRHFRSGRETIKAVDEISIEVPERKLTILRGKSGSGKTTLMNLMGTLDAPTGGRIYFRNREISGIADHQRDELRRTELGFVFQGIALISLMSAFENVDFRMRVAGFDTKQRQKRVAESLSIVGLGKRMYHRPFEMSGGEQQRVAIARAIAHRPSLIFADEPTAELDSHTGLQVMRLFRQLVDEEELTILMTTHDLSLLEAADRVYELQDGRVVGMS